MKKRKTKRNPADATLRNVKAGLRRDDALSRRVRRLERWHEMLTVDVDLLKDAMREIHPGYRSPRWDKSYRKPIKAKRSA